MICIDELGPIAVKTYAGEEYVPARRRATFEPDYGRRGIVWAHGAFEPATGQATLVLSGRRDSASHIQLLEQVVTEFPSESASSSGSSSGSSSASSRWLLIEDNLSTHHSRDVKTALLAWSEIQVQFIPRYAAWLNLIEPWWKILKALALKGRRFETVTELETALRDALSYWNAHRHPFHWRKLPQQQPTAVLGAYGTSLAKLSA